MIIFADRHHNDLYYSLELMARRLGAQLVCPAGMDWYTQGLWKIGDVYPNPENTARQYLDTEQVFQPADGTVVLNEVLGKQDGLYYFNETVHNGSVQGITYKKFQELPIDVVISSYPAHDEPYAKLAEMKGAKHVQQIGNIWRGAGDVKNILASTAPFPVPEGYNAVFYHQEFDRYIYASYVPPTYDTWNITSFINCLPQKARDHMDWVKLIQLADKEFEFKSYGGSCANGSLHTAKEIAAEMQNANFIWHIKEHGDGYGHVLHKAFAVGRPVISRFSDYRDKLGGKLLEHSVTAIDADAFNNHEELAKYLVELKNDRPRYEAMCKAAYDRFMQVVDFEKEAIEIKQFFTTLL